MRLARALALMGVAISLHVWVVAPPYPRPSSLPAFALWLIATPPVPVAPSLQWLGSSSFSIPAAPRVILESTIIRVPPRRRVDRPVREWRLPSPLTIGTNGYRLAASALDPSSPPPIIDVPRAATPSASVDTPRPAALVAARIPETAAAVADAAPTTAAPAPRPVESNRAVATKSIDDEKQQKEAVLALLDQYSRAYERLDVRATKALYPSVDDRKLQRLFADLEGQKMRVSCGVSISSSGADANARCNVDATYRTKVGSRVMRLTDRVWTFSLSRDGGEWQIQNARMQ